MANGNSNPFMVSACITTTTTLLLARQSVFSLSLSLADSEKHLYIVARVIGSNGFKFYVGLSTTIRGENQAKPARTSIHSLNILEKGSLIAHSTPHHLTPHPSTSSTKLPSDSPPSLYKYILRFRILLLLLRRSYDGGTL